MRLFGGLLAGIWIAAASMAPGAALGQEVWTYQTDPTPRAYVVSGEYDVGALCPSSTPHFFIHFPRALLEKADIYEDVRLKFGIDAPDSGSFTVTYVTVSTIREGERVHLWFRGAVALEWIEAMRTARTNVFVAVDTNEDEPRPVFEKRFSAVGSTASLRTFMQDCTG